MSDLEAVLGRMPHERPRTLVGVYVALSDALLGTPDDERDYELWRDR